MPRAQLTAVFQRLCGSALLREHADLCDGELLEEFIRCHDELAFEALVRRHGPMVWGVCRRILQNETDAEDAFQATFLVLVRKAGGIRPRGMVGNWLYGVAQNTARKAKAMNQKRHVKEREASERVLPKASAEDVWERLQHLLDQELPALPDKYRTAIVLCDLEGKSIKEAANQLGWPQGTLATRLTRGRALLAKRLARHGLAVAGGGLAALLSRSAASASVPASLIRTTIRSASLFWAGQATTPGATSAQVAALTEGVLKMMLITKLKHAALVLLALCALGVAGTLVASRIPAAQATKEEQFRQWEKQQRDLKERFANDPGWAWCGDTPMPRRAIGTMRSHSQKSGPAFTAFFDTEPSGALLVTMAYRSKEGALEYRPVAFDAQRKRYPLESDGGGGHEDIRLYRFRLDPKLLPDAKVAFLGFEYLSADGRKIAASDAAEHLRKAGMEPLPWAEIDKPYDFVLTTMDNKKLRSRDLKGKVVLIDCWATWCSPCMAKMATLKPLYEQYHKEGLEIVGICFDHKVTTAQKAIDKHGLAWPQVLAPADETVRGLWERAAGIESLPRLLLIDREGILRAECGCADLSEQIAKLMKKPAGNRH
jgi:RNA polymerase sigma factor (sigma-70 family)